MRVRIITDEFTSASDGLVGLAALPGGAAVVLPWAAGADVPATTPAAAALSVDTDSRLCSAAVAARRAAAWARRWAGADVLLEQFDSTLRGPLAIECAAAWVGQRTWPLAGGAGVPSGRAHDTGWPGVAAWCAGASDLLCERSADAGAREFGARVLLAVGRKLAVARDALHARHLFAAGHRAVVVDAMDEAGLPALVAQFPGNRDILWAGSTGHARRWPSRSRRCQWVTMRCSAPGPGCAGRQPQPDRTHERRLCGPSAGCRKSGCASRRTML